MGLKLVRKEFVPKEFQSCRQFSKEEILRNTSNRPSVYPQTGVTISSNNPEHTLNLNTNKTLFAHVYFKLPSRSSNFVQNAPLRLLNSMSFCGAYLMAVFYFGEGGGIKRDCCVSLRKREQETTKTAFFPIEMNFKHFTV